MQNLRHREDDEPPLKMMRGGGCELVGGLSRDSDCVGRYDSPFHVQCPVAIAIASTVRAASFDLVLHCQDAACAVTGQISTPQLCQGSRRAHGESQRGPSTHFFDLHSRFEGGCVGVLGSRYVKVNRPLVTPRPGGPG